MTVEELKERAAIRHAQLLDQNVTDDVARAAINDTVNDVAEIRFPRVAPNAPQAAFDWTVIIQILLPIILAWIDRRFPPRPAPTPTPVPPGP